MSPGGSEQPRRQPEPESASELPPAAGLTPPAALDAYLDGTLGEAERAAFERHLADDPELRREAQAHRELDDALRRLFVVPLPPPLLGYEPGRDGQAHEPASEASDAPSHAAEAPPNPPPSPATPRPFLRGLGGGRLAAVLLALLVAVGAWSGWRLLHRADVGPAEAGRAIERHYRAESDRGFVPEVAAPTSNEIAATYQRMLGQGMRLRPSPPGVRVLGVSLSPTLSPSTVVLLARVDGRDVMVLADRARDDPAPALPPGSGLNLFRRPVGPLVLYEVTPLEQPRLLNLFYPSPWHRTRPGPNP